MTNRFGACFALVYATFFLGCDGGAIDTDEFFPRDGADADGSPSDRDGASDPRDGDDASDDGEDDGDEGGDGAGDGSFTDGAGDGDGGDGAPGDGDGEGDGAAGDGSPDDAPDIYESFQSLDAFQMDVRSDGGSIQLMSGGGADDGAYVALNFPGNPGFGANDNSGPGYASELIYPEPFLYGKFETRVRFAACAPDEEVVNGLFTYFNDGSDQNGDGLPDNSEIDIELLCGTPHILWLTTYTDYADFAPGRLKKLSRKLDMRTGRYEDYVDWPPETSEQGTLEGIADPGFPEPSTFYTVGFEWRADSVRYYMRIDGREVDLFVIDEPGRVPTRPSQFLMNIWHANSHWTDGAAADYPKQSATMALDWLKIWR